MSEAEPNPEDQAPAEETAEDAAQDAGAESAGVESAGAEATGAEETGAEAGGEQAVADDAAPEAAEGVPEQEAAAAEEATAGPPEFKPQEAATAALQSRQIPPYTRSLLKIPVNVSVTLATKKTPLSQIVTLAPGSIIQFDKSCEELLELCIGGRALADGEAVKVGDKFGLRINSIILPEERFHRLGPPKAG